MLGIFTLHDCHDSWMLVTARGLSYRSMIHVSYQIDQAGNDWPWSYCSAHRGSWMEDRIGVKHGPTLDGEEKAIAVSVRQQYSALSNRICSWNLNPELLPSLHRTDWTRSDDNRFGYSR